MGDFFAKQNYKQIGMRKQLDFYLNNASIENYLELLEMAESCLWYIDCEYRLMSFNKIYLAHMVEFASVIPKVGDKDIVLSCFPKDFADNIFAMYQRAMSGEIVKSIEKGYHADGSRADIIMVFKPVKNDDGEIIGISCLRRDISEYVLIKDQLEVNNRKLTDITWQQSHLFRGPLSTAIGIANLLKEKSLHNVITENECRELLSGLSQRLNDLDNVIREIVKTSYVSGEQLSSKII